LAVRRDAGRARRGVDDVASALEYLRGMFASVRCYYVHKATPRELAERVGEDFADRLSERPGFVAYDFLDCGDGEAMSISVFREETQAHDSRELARRWTQEHLPDMELTITDSLHGPVVESRTRGGRARWASLHGHRGASAASLADAVMALDGVVACRVIDVGAGELLTVGLFTGPVEGEVGVGEILVSREAGVLT
jgi:hypothetical protein